MADRAPSAPTRHAGRKRALDLLYEADLLGRPLAGVLADHLEGDDPPGAFSRALVAGVERHRSELDELISTYAKGWRIERMPVVDRNLLRLGLWEILYDDETPTAVAIDEAVRLAKELSTEDSGRFINGLLDRVASTRTDPALSISAEEVPSSDGRPGAG